MEYILKDVVNETKRQYDLPWLWSFEISVPKDFSVIEVISEAVRRRMWIPCMTIDWCRKILLCEWFEGNANCPFPIITITRNQVEQLLMI